ncbi:MAG: glycosyltransferase [Eubacteriales bacterium]
MKIFYQGAYCTEEVLEKIKKSQLRAPSDARNKVETMFIDGFSENGAEVTAVCIYPGVRAYPGNKKVFWNTTKNIKDSTAIYNTGFVNILILKQTINAFAVSARLFKWLIKNKKDKDKLFFSYSVDALTTSYCMWLCRRFECKTAVYVSEIPSHRLFFGQNSSLRKALLKKQINKEEGLHKRFDYYVLSAPAIKEYFSLSEEQTIIMEGLVPFTENISMPKHDTDKKVILYAGGLNARNGIDVLIDAVLLIEDEQVELHLYGGGDLEQKIGKIAEKNKKIKLKGLQPNEEVLNAELSAAILINPRPADEFTLYSFPSKTVEYMSSGTPTAVCKLPAIPNEYWEYIYEIPQNDAVEMSEVIKRILDDENRTQKGLLAQKFIYEEKNHIKQTKRILSIIKTND